MKIITCPCGKKVKVRPSQEGRKKYCSRKCKDENYVKPLGAKPNYINGNKGWFKKGQNSDSKHPNWVGNKVGYIALHSWIYRKLGKATKCEDCGETKVPKNRKRFFQWANISGKYKRNVTDWKQLCMLCHRKFDGITKLSKKDAAIIIVKYRNGESQKSLATQYNVDKSTISNIVNHKIQYYAA